VGVVFTALTVYIRHRMLVEMARELAGVSNNFIKKEN
jgi:hypothetical protein